MDMAEALNLGCACTTLRPELLAERLTADLGDSDLAAARPHLFSASPVFLDAGQASRIADAVRVLHAVASQPAYREQALSRAADVARPDPGPSGAFMGYDFHVGPEGPRLIEINTNAGGALLHALALAAHQGCCDGGGSWLPPDFEARVFAMFQAEWRSARGEAPLRRVAIVDDAPASQFLAPEFELARRLFTRHGVEAVVCDPRDLDFRDGQLRHAGQAIDLVYNRLTDFDLSEPAHAALRAAYEARAAVVTPHPHAHALHADKRNLVALADAALRERLAVSEADRRLLAEVVPAATRVTPDNADQLWARRRTLFFKPACGFGSRAAWRGDKLTRRVWDEIRAGDYIAQHLVPPSERVVPLADGSRTRLRLDVRAYAFRGEVLLLAARTWAGQTTNFRTPGGGFAPVVVIPSLPVPDAAACIPAEAHLLP